LALQKTLLMPDALRLDLPVTMASLLGVRTAQLHLALSSNTTNPDFVPEKFSSFWQRALFQSMQSLQKRVFELLGANISKLPPKVAGEASQLLSGGDRIVSLYRTILQNKMSAKRIRIHGDYHLGQVLYTGKDFVIIDFEGEPARTLGERRLKVSPMRDVAGMIRSFHYAAYLSLSVDSTVRAEDVPALEPWAELWYRDMSAVFLGGYLDQIKGAGLLPENMGELETLLACFLMDKAVYELGYELNNRPEWVAIPIRGIRYLLESAGKIRKGSEEES
jgi:maltose alpha-D-glucosyltransferase/alpha-amylase